MTIETNVFRILSDLGTTEYVKGLYSDLKLPYGQGTDFDPEIRCLPNTRVEILDEIFKWVNDLSSTRVLVLFGLPGTGKSAIVHEVACIFQHLGRLATSYRFVQGEPSSRDFRFFTTVIQNLCTMDPSFMAALREVNKKNPGLAEMRSYSKLFELGLRDPLQDIFFIGPILITIDAINECEDAGETRLRGPNSLHTFLANRLNELPPNFRILITARPEPEIVKAFSRPSIRAIYMEDFKPTDGDILAYMRTKLNEAEGVTDHILQQLVEKAEGNFQWASIACSYISRPPAPLNSQRCIQRALQLPVSVALHPLDDLYSNILQKFDMRDRDICDNFKSAMLQIFGPTFEPLSVGDLDILFSQNEPTTSKTSTVVKHLGSLLSNVTPGSALPVAPLHSSFLHYLTDKTRSHEFYINLGDAHTQFALATLRTMQTELLETSHPEPLNNGEPDIDLKQGLTNNISTALSYSCRFWVNHLIVSAFDSDVFKSLQMFMKENFQIWLGVFTVGGQMRIVRPALLSLEGWLKQNYGENERNIVIDEICDRIRDHTM